MPLVREKSNDICARRGAEWLSPQRLEAHLAALVQLENVGMFLGAGCSRAAGGKTMGELWDAFTVTRKRSWQWLQEEGFLPSVDRVDVEKLLDTLAITKAEWSRVNRPRKLAQLERVRDDLRRAVIEAALLNEDWWKNPSVIDINTVELADHRRLLQRLTGARQPGQSSPWLFTTNYDLAVEWAAESIGLKAINGFGGFHSRSFSPHNFDLGYRNVLARGEARFGIYNVYLAKLHGSLTWRNIQGSCREQAASHLWPSIEAFLRGESREFAAPLVFPSGAKYVQTVGFVLGELLRRFTEFLARPQSCLLVCGYSFSDEHINRILMSALQNPTLQLVLCTTQAKRTESGPDYSTCCSWVEKVAGLGSPQVTIIGDGKDAYFSKLVARLPEPTLFDERAATIREMLREFQNDTENES